MSNQEYIEFDYTQGGRPRYTHYPSGKTVLRQPWMTGQNWADARAEFFSLFPELPLRDEGGKDIKKP